MRLLALPRLAVMGLALAALNGPTIDSNALADDFPDRPITLMVPLAPGGGMDFIARTIGQKLSERLGKPVLIENRPGGGTVVATVALAKAPPDGYTLLLVPGSTLTSNATVYKSLPYDPRKDFVPIALPSQVAFTLVINPSMPVHSIAELIKYAKEKPGELIVGTAGIATTTHLAGELLAHMTGIKLRYAHYRGSPPAMTDVVAGNIQLLFADPVTGAELAKAGKVRALGVTSKNRISVFPDIPPIATPFPATRRRTGNGHRARAYAGAHRRKAFGGIACRRRDVRGQTADRENWPRAVGQSAGRGTTHVSRLRDCDLGQIRGADRPRRIAVTGWECPRGQSEGHSRPADRGLRHCNHAAADHSERAGFFRGGWLHGAARHRDAPARAGWQPVGRKIGFTNRTIWPRYGVYQPMWAHVWTRTVHFARDGKASLPLQSFVQPRIEPEVVFKLKGPVPLTDDPDAVLAAVEWIAPGFEIVQSHFPDWKFSAADCARRSGCMARW